MAGIMIKRNVPLVIVRIIAFWYQTQTMCVKWGKVDSEYFNVSNGVRQGGILSPKLFAIYVDDLSHELTLCKSGCYIEKKTQGILLKTALGLPKNRRNSPLFAALGIEKIDQFIKRQQLTLLRNALQSNSKARTFYMGMMRMYNQGNIDQYPASLLSRCKRICNSEQFSLHKYIFDNKYETECKRKLKSITRDGTVDSISNLLKNYNHDSKQLVNLLLKPY